MNLGTANFQGATHSIKLGFIQTIARQHRHPTLGQMSGGIFMMASPPRSVEEEIEDDQHKRGNTQEPTQKVLTHVDSPKLQMPLFSKAHAGVAQA